MVFLGIAGDAPVVELGLHQAALAQVQRAVGCDQPVAQQVLEGLGGATPAHAPMIGDESLLHEVRMVDEVHQGWLHRQSGQIAIGGCIVYEGQQVE